MSGIDWTRLCADLLIDTNRVEWGTDDQVPALSEGFCPKCLTALPAPITGWDGTPPSLGLEPASVCGSRCDRCRTVYIFSAVKVGRAFLRR